MELTGSIEPKVWKPHARQEQMIALPFTIFEGLYGGAAFGGKSELLVLLPLIYRFHEHPKFKGIILRRTFPELESEIILRSHDYYGSAGGDYNKQLRRWTFPSGAIINFGHAENEQDIRKYDGVEYNYVAFDELTHFTEFQYLYLVVSRCRSSSSELPAIVRSATNPGNIGHAWVRKRFVEPCPEGNKIIVDRLTGHKRFFLQAKATDNPYGMRNDPGYISRMEMLPEAEKRAKLYGDWWTFSGQVFDNFRIEPLSDEPGNARHVIDPFPIPEFWPKILAIDWGFTAKTWCGFGAVSPDGRVYLYKELVFQQTPIAEWATEVGFVAKREKNLKLCILDTNAWDQRGEEQTVAQQVQNYSGLKFRPASKGRVSGKILLQEYLRWKQKPKSLVDLEFNSNLAEQILRFRGTKAYNEYLEQFKPAVDETNLPKLQIFSCCSEVIRVIPLCIYDERNPEDVAEFEGDDAYDGLRYLLKAADRYKTEAQDENERIRSEAQIYENLAKTNDYTSFYIAKSRLDAQTRRFGVKRYHRRMS